MYFFILGIMCFNVCCCFDCLDGPPGRYCNDNLTGYYNCFNNGTSVYLQCQPGTRCSCYINNQCVTNDICSSFSIPLPMISSFVLYYKGYQETRRPQGTYIENLHGTIRQETVKKQFFQENIVGSTHTFVLIVPSKNNKEFKMYEGTFNKSCSNTKLKEFSGFLNELTHFTKMSVKNVNKCTTEETYYFRNGRRHLGQSLTTWEWVVKNNLIAKTLEPIFFKSSFYGSEIAKQSTIISWTSITLVPSYSNDTFFQIPNICKI
ncbi:uncharacterized protein LOC105847528 [Hydra vulgaris]|uniref:uncharacterized protein LOC105847528 n=1 Tax=Hydra vulgaris TaxID=6087 RepID=UPI000641143D|nr:uncharacterized protein LOC105847528 [Hydra vulgaris]